MGCDCSSNENETDRDMDPNTFGQSKIRVRGSPSDELDFESETEGTSAVVTHTNREKQQARRGFKDAVLEGNESSVMHYVHEYKDVDLLGLIMQDGQTALPNSKNKNSGDTPLHAAVEMRSVKALALLCKYGGDPMAMNDAWASAMTMAELSDQKIARLLKPRNREELLEHLALADEINTSQTELPLGNNISSTTRSLQYSEVPSIRDSPLSKIEDIDVEAMENPLITPEDDRIDATIDVGNIASSTNEELPQMMSGYMEKKGSMNRWQRRWVVIQSGWFCWNDKEISAVGDVKEETERQRFNGSVQVLDITNIQMISAGKTHRKFSFVVKGDGAVKSKDYLWRASDREKRAQWVEQLKRHRKYQEHARKSEE